jgi:hypothetical protein
MTIPVEWIYPNASSSMSRYSRFSPIDWCREGRWWNWWHHCTSCAAVEVTPVEVLCLLWWLPCFHILLYQYSTDMLVPILFFNIARHSNLIYRAPPIFLGLPKF